MRSHITFIFLLSVAASAGVWAAEPTTPAKPAETATPAKPAEAKPTEARPDAKAPTPAPQEKSADTKPADAKSPADQKASPQRFIPSEQVRADFDVSFPIDI